jgi:formylmethanofuran dehydrogenase subunit B
MPEPLVCAGCALLCDDAVIADGRLQPACPVGTEWLAEGCIADGASDTPEASVAGEPVAIEVAVARAAELLRDGRRPLVHGFVGATVEDARAAVALADRLGAIVATAAPSGPWPGVPAFPLRGASTATLGEVRDRSELVVIWREDPQTTHPRLLERLGFGGVQPTATGSGGDLRRLLAVVDDRDTPTARLAGLRLSWAQERDADALGALHVLERGREHRDPDGGLRAQLDPLTQQLRSAAHATVVYGRALAAGDGGQRRTLALHELVRELSHGRHVVTLSLEDAPGVRGAAEVLTWQTGYPGPVDLGHGHPELVTCAEPLIEHERIDVALRVEDDPTAAGDAAVIALSNRPGTPAPDVWIRTAPAGVGAGGTMHRLDNVPLALRPPRPSTAPSAAELIHRLLGAVSG